jgi:hypothetical protein
MMSNLRRIYHCLKEIEVVDRSNPVPLIAEHREGITVSDRILVFGIDVIFAPTFI